MGLDLLAAYDGSDPAKRALTYACELSDLDGGSVTAAYVVQPDVYHAACDDGLANVSERYRRQVLDTIDEAEAAGQQTLDEAVTVAADQGHTIDTTLLYGDPVNEIINYAETNGFHTIVVGHRGAHERPNYPVGSVAKTIIERSNIPVTVTR